MSKIRIKNFGPIKEGYAENDGWIDIKKVTVFIGNQGSGKSTVAKLISNFTWMEKVLTRGNYDKKEFERKDVLKRYLAYHKIENYFNYPPSKNNSTVKLYHNSEIEYIGDSYSFKYNQRHLSITESPAGNYPLPQVMYVPADRNFLSSIEDRKTQRVVSPALRELLDEMDNAQKDLKGDLNLPINNAQLEYDKRTDILYLKGNNYKIKLSESSSGFQSFIPLFLVTQYLTRTINLQCETQTPMNADELERFKKSIAEIYANPNFTSDQRRAASSALAKIFNKTAFVNIVEEPEQNLFPTSQWEMLKSLLEYNNSNDRNKLIITTHSPYIINHLTLAAKGYLVEQKIKEKKKELELNSKLEAIVPLKSVVNASDLVIYELDDSGEIIKLGDYNGLPSDDNYLNESLAETNDLFAKLLDIEDLCQ